ncbi:MAG: hypothetical protein WCR31_00755 [Treponema sp.]
MDNEKIKQILLDIQNSKLEFTVIQTGKDSKRVNGLYKPDTHEILLHNKNFKTDNQLIYTAVHEYTHHLITEEILAVSGSNAPLNAKVHNQAFWAKFNELIKTAEKKGYYVIGIENSPELEKLTEEIRKNYLEKNGNLMQEFGRLLAKAHELCEQANIRYEDYVDRVLCLPRNSARDIAKLGIVPVNPALGFDNMKLVAGIRKPEDRNTAEQQLMNGTSPVSVREMMRRNNTLSRTDDPKAKLEKEKSRLEKTIAQLQQRLEYVEDALGNI